MSIILRPAIFQALKPALRTCTRVCADPPIHDKTLIQMSYIRSQHGSLQPELMQPVVLVDFLGVVKTTLKTELENGCRKNSYMKVGLELT